MWRDGRAVVNALLVLEAGFFQPAVRARAVDVNQRSSENRRFDERNQVCTVTTTDLLNTDSSKPYEAGHLNRDDDDHLVSTTLALKGAPGVITLRECEKGFIHLNHTFKQIAVGPNHGSAQPMQYGPSGLVAAKTQYALQA